MDDDERHEQIKRRNEMRGCLAASFVSVLIWIGLIWVLAKVLT